MRVRSNPGVRWVLRCNGCGRVCASVCVSWDHEPELVSGYVCQQCGNGERFDFGFTFEKDTRR